MNKEELLEFYRRNKDDFINLVSWPECSSDISLKDLIELIKLIISDELSNELEDF